MALIYYTQDFRVYEETRDQPMPGPFPAPPVFWGKSPGDEVGMVQPLFSPDRLNSHLGDDHPLSPIEIIDPLYWFPRLRFSHLWRVPWCIKVCGIGTVCGQDAVETTTTQNKIQLEYYSFLPDLFLLRCSYKETWQHCPLVPLQVFPWWAQMREKQLSGDMAMLSP